MFNSPFFLNRIQISSFIPLSNGIISFFNLSGSITDSLSVLTASTATGVTYTSSSISGSSMMIILGPAPTPASASVSVWIKTATAASMEVFTSDQADYPTYYHGMTLQCNADGSVLFLCGTNIGASYSRGSEFDYAQGPTGSYADNVWHHIVGTHDGVTIKIYIDGNLVGSQPWAHPIEYSTDTRCRIGSQHNTVFGAPSDSAYFVGMVNRLGVWNRAITAAEVTQLYNLGTGSSYPF